MVEEDKEDNNMHSQKVTFSIHWTEYVNLPAGSEEHLVILDTPINSPTICVEK